MSEAYIVAAGRTAGGRRRGRLASVHPVDLAAQLLDGLIDRAAIDPALVEDVVMGCVGQGGEQSQNVARNAVLASRRLPESVPGVSVDRQCGSSQQALHFATALVKSGIQDVVIAAGVEHMTRVPMFSPSTLAEQAGMEAPIPATAHALKKSGMSIADIGAYEINEAFASIPMAWLQATHADPARLNRRGGSIALGHPLGATGTKLLSTLLCTLDARKERWGLQVMCEGGGLANVTIVENLRR